MLIIIISGCPILRGVNNVTYTIYSNGSMSLSYEEMICVENQWESTKGRFTSISSKQVFLSILVSYYHLFTIAI